MARPDERGGMDDESLWYLRNRINVPCGKYGSVAWIARYASFSEFGESVQGLRYWVQAADWMGMGEKTVLHGGVCGAMSTLAAHAAAAHEIPATTVGYPTHCAYAWRPERGKWKDAFGGKPGGLPHNFIFEGPAPESTRRMESAFADDRRVDRCVVLRAYHRAGVAGAGEWLENILAEMDGACPQAAARRDGRARCPQRAALPTYADAVKKGGDVFALCVGSDWLPGSGALAAAFADAAKRAPRGVSFAVYDLRSDLTAAEENALGKLPCTVWCHPALVYRDGEGRPLFLREGISASDVADAPRIAADILRLRKNRDAALASARAMPDGRAKAAALGNALSPTLDPVLASYSDRTIGEFRKSVKGIVAEILKADPDDADSWAAKYTLDNLDVYTGEMKGATAEKCREIAERCIAKPALLPRQRQMAHLLLYKAERDAAGKTKPLDKALGALERGIAVDPASPLAAAMRNMVEYWKSPKAKR